MSQQTETPHQVNQGFSAFIRKDLVGGCLLLIAMLAALVLANSPAQEFYFGLRDYKIGTDAVPGLMHTVGEWAADGLLAVFFFLVGLELKAEFVDGELRNPRKAALPIVAAFAGVITPALIYVGVNLVNNTDPTALRGWAIPTATDIAFAVSVLAVVGSALPLAMRTFLLTLAVVDDLIAIIIIALFYSYGISLLSLGGALVALAVYWALTHRFSHFFIEKAWAAWLILLPLGFITWLLVYNGGVHATIAGVLLGFATPVMAIKPRLITRDTPAFGLAPTLEHRFRPLSNILAVPIFAFFSAGVAVGGWAGFTESLTDPVAIGIFSSAWLMNRFTPARKDADYEWIDLIGLSIVAGIGFTVSLLVADLSFGLGSPHDNHAKVGILCGSGVAAVVGGALLLGRNAYYSKLRTEGDRVDSYDDPA
ncbi:MULTISPECIES: Na+/H+ antiporter NhaA [Kocuria]|uniref:Na(+)/H(+) antiporter NhaA n=1 Tax=Kocuria subflava TaxID=1736139 RepID=A0A846TLU9_9MICC|nr:MULTISPECIES: Na+/H+ antiporter NhaA [Kocuria]NKE09423.1 Na+/H+ antiporter NhaA [Kocuria subflava]